MPHRSMSAAESRRGQLFHQFIPAISSSVGDCSLIAPLNSAGYMGQHLQMSVDQMSSGRSSASGPLVTDQGRPEGSLCTVAVLTAASLVRQLTASAVS